MFQALRALFVATPNLQAQWNVHYGAHQFWKQVVYGSFKVADIHQVLNVDPHGEHYNPAIPDYFQWVDQNINSMPPAMRTEAIQIVEEAASIADVVALHQCLHTPYDKFFKRHGLKNVV
jgi:hypothetical protein